jgi:hypothetical protein
VEQEPKQKQTTKHTTKPTHHFQSSRRNIITTRRNNNGPATDILIIDTGGGTQPTITERAWKVTHRHNIIMMMQGYQNKGPPLECPIVNALTKAQIPGWPDPVIFEVNHATLIKDQGEFESLVVPFEMMKHGIKVDMTPSKYGGTNSISICGEVIPYIYDDEKLFWEISKPTQDDLDTLRWIELTPPVLLGENRARRIMKEKKPHNIPWVEWRKRLAMLPDEVVKKTVLEATTQFYMQVENENRSEP